VSVVGRPVFDKCEWNRPRCDGGSGGVAAAIFYRQYERDGTAALERLNGNCLLIVHDAARSLVHLVTDYCGVVPAFEFVSAEGRLYCSHPDVLAEACGERNRLDESSMAEFILSGTVTPPFSYYERIRAVDSGTIFTFRLSGDRPEAPVKRRYFEFAYVGDPAVTESDLADRLAAALHRAVERRMHPLLGTSALGLSGGLDSRVVLACVPDRRQALAFTCYDEPNREYKTAEAIAKVLSVPFIPVRRGYDYYANNAAQGVRMSAGMGTFANNHFLGVIPHLKSKGVQNLLTGCYCDYLFKGLPLNRRFHSLTRREELGPFRHEFYFDHFPGSGALARRARERWESRVPSELRKQDSPATVFQIEARRTFPLCYEGDNQQRVVPQRVIGWCPPFLDRDVIETYCRTPYYFKLNRSLFRKVTLALPPQLLTIPDSSTGAALDASAAWEWARAKQIRLWRKCRRTFRAAASDESWPNWPHYVRHSPRLDALWKRPNPDAMDLFRRVLGPSALPHDVGVLKRDRPFLFVGLLTIKLWLDQRMS
jgi:asparagine synthase (glutamine-hydrolysing)